MSKVFNQQTIRAMMELDSLGMGSEADVQNVKASQSSKDFYTSSCLKVNPTQTLPNLNDLDLSNHPKYVGLGTNSRAIYDVCAKKYGWNKGLSGMFTFGHNLYASDATLEHMGVWMISNSNYQDSYSNEHYSNTISPDFRTITECWNNKRTFEKTDDYRVVFLRRNPYYQFLGVYKLIEWNDVTKTSVFELVSFNYDQKHNAKITQTQYVA